MILMYILSNNFTLPRALTDVILVIGGKTTSQFSSIIELMKFIMNNLNFKLKTHYIIIKIYNCIFVLLCAI